MEPAVVINATSIGRVLGGIGIYGIHLIRALARSDSRLRLQLVLNRSARPHLADVVLPPHMSVRWVGDWLSPDRGSAGHLLRFLHANQLALRRGPALVFATSQIEAALLGSPGVVMVHDTIPLLFAEHHPRQRHFYRHLLGPALRAAAAVITPSWTTKALLEEHYGLNADRIRVIPHGVPVPSLARPVDSTSGRPFILSLGRAGPMKNIATLREAYRRLEPEIREDLVFAGAERPAHWPPEERVVFMGPVTDAEKVDLLDRASLLVCPSLHEGFGFPPVEAMARGCPVIAARAGSLPEVCADAAHYVEPLDVAGMAAAMRAVLSQPPLRRELSERGLRRVRAFSWEASAREHLELFEAVLALRARAPLPSMGD
jgi:glycosyltransferase involved in cell wall biosynthesis